MFGSLLKRTLDEVGISSENLFVDEQVKTTLAFVHTFPDGDREFSFYRNPGADMMLTEENLSEMLFKLAVEVSKSNILSARNSELNDYALNYLNDVSEQLVAEHNGVLDLEKARDFVNGEENG